MLDPAQENLQLTAGPESIVVPEVDFHPGLHFETPPGIWYYRGLNITGF